MQNFVAIAASLHARSCRRPPTGTVAAVKTYRWTILAMAIGAVLLVLVVVLLLG
jgi:hypothetical protein